MNIQKYYPSIVLKKGKDEAVKRFHPWIFSGAIYKMPDNISNGDLVSVWNFNNEFLGIGHYQDATIAVRLLTFKNQIIDKNFWLERIRTAYLLREQLNLTKNKATNAFRLVHAEGDHLPGLIIDFYNGVIVIQTHSLGMYYARNEISLAIKELFGTKVHTIFLKTSDGFSKLNNDKVQDEFLFGNNKEIVISENENQFFVDFIEGQKTGFFLDQRENRKLIASFARNKKILNTFCYSGGFSIYALQAGATLVHSVDSSKQAIDLLEKNIELNKLQNHNHQSYCMDVSSFFKQITESYDVIILDPPAYAKHLDARHQAIQAYKRLNLKAFQKIAANGLLATFSCSQVVDRNMFKSAVVAAAIEAKREVKILYELSQPPDHPINAFHPEGAYLKGLLLLVH